MCCDCSPNSGVSIVAPPKKATKAYPISTFTYAIVPGNAPQATAVKEFITYAITKGGNNIASFHAEDTYDAFDGKTSDVNGTIIADPANPIASSVVININVDSLEYAIWKSDALLRRRDERHFTTATATPGGTP